jgi:hypothetical protein
MTENRPPLIPGIGFSGPNQNAPREAAPDLPSKPAESVSPTENPEAELATTPAKPKTKEEKEKDYLAGLDAVGLSRVEARTIQEAVLVGRYYEEEFTLGSKATVLLRTRGYADVQRAMRYLEVEAPTYNMAINDLIARYNMAASLVRYCDQTFKFPQKREGATSEEIEKAFMERYDFVMDLPTIAVDKLMKLNHKFDMKVAAVFEEGAPEDF